MVSKYTSLLGNPHQTSGNFPAHSQVTLLTDSTSLKVTKVTFLGSPGPPLVPPWGLVHPGAAYSSPCDPGQIRGQPLLYVRPPPVSPSQPYYVINRHLKFVTGASGKFKAPYLGTFLLCKPPLTTFPGWFHNGAEPVQTSSCRGAIVDTKHLLTHQTLIAIFCHF